MSWIVRGFETILENVKHYTSNPNVCHHFRVSNRRGEVSHFTVAVTYLIVTTTSTRCNPLSTITPTVFIFPEMFLCSSGNIWNCKHFCIQCDIFFRNDQQQGALPLQYSDNSASNYYRPYNDHDDILRKLPPHYKLYKLDGSRWCQAEDELTWFFFISFNLIFLSFFSFFLFSLSFFFLSYFSFTKSL